MNRRTHEVGRVTAADAPMILVVDDDPAVRAGLAELLRAESYQVVVEADAAGGLESIRIMKPDVVLLDVQLPDLSGFEVCRRVKENPESRLTPIVFLTGLSAIEDRVRGLDAGGDDFLSKPAERVELVARVRSLLRVKHYTERLERAEGVLLALARSIEGKDPHTEGHCDRLSSYAAELGRRIGLPDEEMEALEFAGQLHDIGKLAVPDAILLKQGPLTPKEWETLRRHPITGEHICAPIKSFRRVLPIIRHHHERCDGTGYPDALVGDEIPLTAKVLQIVDVYDALTTARPYKPPLSVEEALNTMDAEVERGWWDPTVYAEFKNYVLEKRDEHRAASSRSTRRRDTYSRR